MALALALTSGVLFASGLYLLMQRTLLRLVLGVVAIGHGANLAVFSAGGLVRGVAPLVAVGQPRPPAGAADPLPQALLLTAIVIGLAVTAFTATLVWRVYYSVGSDDTDEMTLTDSGED